MTLTKNRLACALLTVLTATSASAEVVIISDSQPAANKPNFDELVVDSEPSGKIHSIDVDELPLVFVIDNIADSNWSISYSDGIENTPITWKGEHTSWLSLVKFIAIDHDIKADIDLESKRITISAPSVSQVDSEKDTNKPVTNTDSQDVADGVMTCMAIGCERQAIDIEKLAIDNSWFTPMPTNEARADSVSVDPRVEKLIDGEADLENYQDAESIANIDIDELEQKERLNDLTRETEQRAREAKMRSDFTKATVLHGRGTYEEWMNGGGLIPHGTVDPEKKYTYLLKKGSMFDNVENWARQNGYHVDNVIKDKLRRDFQIRSDVYIYGSFYEVTTNLLKRYRKADFPVNHTFFTKGKTLRIFSDKYNITKY